jgi:hypothetical protein
LHHHLTKNSSGIETGGALNLSQNNQDGSSQQHLQQQQQQWMAQSDYFGSGSFAHWMTMGLEQPPSMVPSSYPFGQGLRSELEQQQPQQQQQHSSRSYTPADSVHSGTKNYPI